MLLNPGGGEADGVRSALSSRDLGFDVDVNSLEDRGRLYDELCLGTVHCLAIPPESNDVAAADLYVGIRGLFPDLPVVALDGPDDGPEGESVTVVDAASFDDERVVDAIADALAGPVDSDAARPPSRMETLLLSMFDQFPVHLYAKDDEARHVMVSRHAFDPTDMVGTTDLDYTELPPDHREAAYSDELEILETGEPILDIEEYTDYIDEHTLTSKVPWYDEDEDIVGLAGVTRDITQWKQREQASRRRHELLVKVALVAAHEFRNELQVASGRLQLVDVDSPQLDAVEESHDRLSNLVDEVIALASQERTDRDSQQIWLSTFAREVWDTQADQSTSLSTEAATLEVLGDARLVVDPESASLLLRVLFENAIEHAGPDVTVTVGATEDGVFVADDGPGVEVDPVERVFDAGYSTEGDNSGFGLHLAQRIATDRDWTLTVTNTSEGARFDVEGIDVERSG